MVFRGIFGGLQRYPSLPGDSPAASSALRAVKSAPEKLLGLSGEQKSLLARKRTKVG